MAYIPHGFLNHQHVKSRIFEESHPVENIEPKSETGYRRNFRQSDRVVLFAIRVNNYEDDVGGIGHKEKPIPLI
jgi:hypothetical protein